MPSKPVPGFHYGQLKQRERVILYLYLFRNLDPNERFLPPSVSARFIAQNLGINITHISRVMKPLMEEGLVTRKKAHVIGIKAKTQYCYALTDTGIRAAEHLMSDINITEKELKTMWDLTGYETVNVTAHATHAIYPTPEQDQPSPYGAGQHPKPYQADTMFIDRKTECTYLLEWCLKDISPICIVAGRRGIGKTALLNYTHRKLTEEYKDKVEVTFLNASGLEPPALEREMASLKQEPQGTSLPCVLLIDGLELPSKDRIGFIDWLRDVRPHDIKTALGVRIRNDEDITDLPYTDISMVRLGGLDTASIAAMLGTDDLETVGIITSITGGNPLAVRMIYEPKPKVPEGMNLEEYFFMKYIRLKGAGVV